MLGKTTKSRFHLFEIEYVALKRAVLIARFDDLDLGSLSTDTAGKLDVLGHDGDTLGMDGAQVGILKETDKVSFRCFLESHDS